MKTFTKWVAVVVAVLAGAWMIATVVRIAADQAEGRESRAELAAEVDQLEEESDANAAALEVANQRLRDAGKQPVEEPVDGEPLPEVIEGEPGARGPRGQSCIEEIGRTACRGDNGAAGSAGSDGRAGTDGDTGATGEKGDQGDVGPMGPQGPAGPAGKDGVDGKDGAPGRGIASLYCSDDGRWAVTYTDGATEDAGVCRAPLIPVE